MAKKKKKNYIIIKDILEIKPQFLSASKNQQLLKKFFTRATKYAFDRQLLIIIEVLIKNIVLVRMT